MESHKILQIINGKTGLSEIVSSEYIKNFDLTLQCFENIGLFGAEKRVKTIMEIDDPLDVLNSDVIKESFENVLFESISRKRFINVENFCFTRDGTKCATKDLRILINDNRGDIPREMLLHIASIAASMLTGIIEYPIGYDYISNYMEKYGKTTFSSLGKGYLHINVGIRDDISTQSKALITETNPKSEI
jgi:hypothetical protein